MFGYKAVFRLGFQKSGTDFKWDTSPEIDDDYGAKYHHLFCKYTDAYRTRILLTGVTIDLQIWDLEHRSGSIVAFADSPEIYLTFRRDLVWVPRPAIYLGGNLTLSNSLGLAPLFPPPPFETRTPKYRWDGDVDSGYLSKLGFEVRKFEALQLQTWFAQRPFGTYYVNPQHEMYRNFVRYLLINRYEKREMDIEYDTDKGNISTNRSSTVTLFHRADQGTQMLFTADAYDCECDIRRTIFGFTDAPKYIGLQIPHHGSEVTVDSTFYETVRAEVYLICADHNNVSQNPRFSTLVAIVKSLKGRTRSSGQPFRMFCSSSRIWEEYPDRPSAVRELLKSDRWKPTKTGNHLDYEVYCPSAPSDGKSTYSRVLFAAMKPMDPNNPKMGEMWLNDEWELLNGAHSINANILIFGKEHSSHIYDVCHLAEYFAFLIAFRTWPRMLHEKWWLWVRCGGLPDKSLPDQPYNVDVALSVNDETLCFAVPTNLNM
ncbi:hypothetical protein EJ06DRAFT_518604 [Trichodelitschia bisporula]|uniref:Uncharacterized protein n=1 Tax=Trichodelitschia bisporula TaxID=703511 RepID=A0A6G1I802_9PEZI|nr:hypothetical protein EJ06DRAFT_518604 [Trichodelitschia bisporula]